MSDARPGDGGVEDLVDIGVEPEDDAGDAVGLALLYGDQLPSHRRTGLCALGSLREGSAVVLEAILEIIHRDDKKHFAA